MISYKKHLEYFFLAGICSGIGIGIKYISEMSQNIQLMTVSIQVLTEKLTTIDRTTQDHEMRLRNLEQEK